MRATRLRAFSALVGQTILELALPGTMPITFRDLIDFRAFFQQVLNRAGVGNVRYGEIDTRKRYMTRIGKELRAYRRTGNVEHLLNIAVYAWLESVRPEHRKQHWDATAESATRAEMGGNIA